MAAEDVRTKSVYTPASRPEDVRTRTVYIPATTGRSRSDTATPERCSCNLEDIIFESTPYPSVVFPLVGVLVGLSVTYTALRLSGRKV